MELKTLGDFIRMAEGGFLSGECVASRVYTGNKNIPVCAFDFKELSKCVDNRFKSVTFKNCYFSSNVSCNLFLSCKFLNCTFTKEVRNNFIKCSFDAVRFSGCDFTSASFQGCKFRCRLGGFPTCFKQNVSFKYYSGPLVYSNNPESFYRFFEIAKLVEINPPKFGYKLVYLYDLNRSRFCACNAIAKLSFPSDAKFIKGLNNPDNKIRANKAFVEEVYYINGAELGIPIDASKADAVSMRDFTFKYKKGTSVKPTEKFSTKLTDCCGSGIHFFRTVKQAANY